MIAVNFCNDVYTSALQCFSGQVPTKPSSLHNESYNHNNDRHQEHKNRNAVDAVHIFHPGRLRFIGVAFAEVKVARQLVFDAHTTKLRLSKTVRRPI